MTLPLKCGAHRAWSAWRRPLPGRWGPVASFHPCWAAARTRRLPAVWMENHESGWKILAVGREWERGKPGLFPLWCEYIYVYTLHVCVQCGYSQWFCLSSRCSDTQQCSVQPGDGTWCDSGLDTRERCCTRKGQKSPQTLLCCCQEWYVPRGSYSVELTAECTRQTSKCVTTEMVFVWLYL